MGRKLAWVAALLVMLALRLVAPHSDAYGRLDWSAGLLTDEGFYIHNARNVALFGRARTDEFNNMLLAPVLHLAQTAVFQTIGAGAAQARLVSIACSLLALLLLWDALRRTFDNRIAGAAVLLLGLDHTYLLYNRLAYMDTPASLGAVASFWAFARAMQAGTGASRRRWLAACGALAALTVINRTLCVFLLPVPFVALRVAPSPGQDRRRGYMTVAIAMAVVLGLYALLWYLPHRAEIGAMNRYYRTQQIQPKSVRHLLENLQHAAVGDFRGMAPYLFRHTPIVFVLALLALGAGRSGIERERDVSPGRTYLVTWLILGWGLIAVISYSPSRYYVSTLPAMAALAAIAIVRLPEWWAGLRSGARRVRLLRAVLGASVAFHTVEAFVHRNGVLPPLATALLLWGAPLLAGALAWALPRRGTPSRVPPAMAATTAWALWAAVNGVWLGHWLVTLDDSQYRVSRRLASLLPAGSVVIGDVAPGICLDNPFVAVNVIPGLCNGDRPVERFAGRPRYIAILDGRWKERYWLDRYPALVAPERRILLARVLRWDVGVYAVDSQPESARR